MFQQGSAGKRIVLTTFGSLGDLHPYIAVALELKRRGHSPVIATTHYYREKIEAEGIEFHRVRPDTPPLEESVELIERTLDRKSGAEFLIRDFILPHLRESYDDLRAATEDADVLLSHPLTYAAPLVAEKTGITWVSSVLAPASFFSAYDPAVLHVAPNLHPLLTLSPLVARFVLRLGRRVSDSWYEEVRRLRRELGLPPGGHPAFEGQHSSQLVLALFSPVLAAPQKDWPPNTHVTGFAFYDRTGRYDGTTVTAQTMPGELKEFLDAGEPPIVFTLGSSAVWVAREFYRESVRAAVELKRRAVLLIGDKRNSPAETLPEGIAAFDYAPFSELLPRASAVVHPGGIGSTGQTLRAGVPALVVPYSYDQPDNANRVARIGAARSLEPDSYTCPRVVRELSLLLNEKRYAERAREVGRMVRSEDGAKAACDLVDKLLAQTSSPPLREKVG